MTHVPLGWLIMIYLILKVIQIVIYYRFKLFIFKVLMIALNFWQEFEELTNKIHEYQLREQRLQEQISMRGTPPPSPTPPNRQSDEEPAMTSPGPPLTPITSTAQSHQLHDQRSPKTIRSTKGGLHVKAYLPLGQVTSVRSESFLPFILVIVFYILMILSIDLSSVIAVM